MAARYYMLVSAELLPHIRRDDLPDRIPGLHFGHIVEAPTPPGTELVVLEDENAPEDLNGKTVDLAIIRTVEAGHETLSITRRVVADFS